MSCGSGSNGVYYQWIGIPLHHLESGRFESDYCRVHVPGTTVPLLDFSQFIQYNSIVLVLASRPLPSCAFGRKLAEWLKCGITFRLSCAVSGSRVHMYFYVFTYFTLSFLGSCRITPKLTAIRQTLWSHFDGSVYLDR
jgi:hypothetical protein